MHYAKSGSPDTPNPPTSETIMSDSEEERKFFGANKSIETVPDGERNGRNMSLQFNLITAIFPAVNVDVGDSTIKVTEVFKKI